MDGDNFRIRHQCDDGQRNDCPISRIENEQGDEHGKQTQAVKFCEIRMCGRIFYEADEADKNDGNFRSENQCDGRPIFGNDRAT